MSKPNRTRAIRKMSINGRDVCHISSIKLKAVLQYDNVDGFGKWLIGRIVTQAVGE